KKPAQPTPIPTFPIFWILLNLETIGTSDAYRRLPPPRRPLRHTACFSLKASPNRSHPDLVGDRSKMERAAREAPPSGSRASVVLPGCARLPRGEPGFFFFVGQITVLPGTCVSHDFRMFHGLVSISTVSGIRPGIRFQRFHRSRKGPLR